MDIIRAPADAKADDKRKLEQLLDLWTSVRADLQSGLHEGEGYPEELAGDISRMFDAIDEATAKLRNVIRTRGLPR